MIYLAYAVYVFTFIAGIVLIRRGWKEHDSLDLMGGVFFVAGMTAVILLSIKAELEPEPTEIIDATTSFVKYEFGEVGIKAFQDEDGTVFVVSCFQGEGDTVTNCWDKRFKKDEE